MTPGEVGSYVRILCHMADKGPLTMFQLKQIAEGDTLTQDLISRLTVDEDGNYYSERLNEVQNKRKKFRESRINNLNGGVLSHHMGSHMGNGNANAIKDQQISFSEFVVMTQGQYDQLANKLGKTVLDKYVERLNNYIGSKGKKYKSHYHTILNWHSLDGGAKPSVTRPVQDRDQWERNASKSCTNCRGTGAVYAPGSGMYAKCGCVK